MKKLIDYKTQGTITAFLGTDRKNAMVFPMHSMTMNYWRFLNSGLRGVLSNAIVRKDGSEFSLSNSTSNSNRFTFLGGEGDLLGLVLGNGTAPFSIQDIDLSGTIIEGTSTNRLNYLENIIDLNDSQLVFSRVVENNSGAPIEVTEIGLFGRNLIDPDSLENPYLFGRDILPEPFTIPDNESATFIGSLFVDFGTRNASRFFQNSVSETALETFFMEDGGTDLSLPHSISCVSSPTVISRGLVFGTGTDPEEYLSIDIGGKITNGSGIGELIYSDSEVSGLTITEKEISWTMKREVLNDSSEVVLIREAGVFSSIDNAPFLLFKTVFQSPIVIASGSSKECQLTFRYVL